jgi:hypothetical protein
VNSRAFLIATAAWWANAPTRANSADDERAPREERQHPEQLTAEEQRIAREGPQPVGAHPRRVGDARVARHVRRGSMGSRRAPMAPILSDPKRHLAVATVEPPREAGARAQPQPIVGRLHQPDARERRVELRHEPVGDRAQQRPEVEHARHLQRDARERVPRGFGGGRWGSGLAHRGGVGAREPPRAFVGDHGGPRPWPRYTVAWLRELLDSRIGAAIVRSLTIMDEAHDGMAGRDDEGTRRRALEERLRTLEGTRAALVRSTRRAPWLALGALGAVPAGVVWGAAAALGVMALAVVVAGLVMYLAWSHEQEYAAQQDTVRQSLAEVGRPSARRGIPWRVPGKALNW